MIRAASIPHLGQTTPTAAFGLRAIRSLLMPLDAGRPLTVRVSEIESFRVLKFTTFAIQSETCKSRPTAAAAAYPTFVDTTAGTATFPWAWDPGISGRQPTFVDILVPWTSGNDAIVGDLACKSKRRRAQVRKQA